MYTRGNLQAWPLRTTLHNIPLPFLAFSHLTSTCGSFPRLFNLVCLSLSLQSIVSIFTLCQATHLLCVPWFLDWNCLWFLTCISLFAGVLTPFLSYLQLWASNKLTCFYIHKQVSPHTFVHIVCIQQLMEGNCWNKFKQGCEILYTVFIWVIGEMQTEMDLESVQRGFLFSYTELRPEAFLRSEHISFQHAPLYHIPGKGYLIWCWPYKKHLIWFQGQTFGFEQRGRFDGILRSVLNLLQLHVIIILH